MQASKNDWRLLSLFEHVRDCTLAGAQLLGGKSLSAGAASPLCGRSPGVASTLDEPRIFTGIERHPQFAAASEAQSLLHSYCVLHSDSILPTAASPIWSELNSL
jgi:hypothetical protein